MEGLRLLTMANTRCVCEIRKKGDVTVMEGFSVATCFILEDKERDNFTGKFGRGRGIPTAQLARRESHYPPLKAR